MATAAPQALAWPPPRLTVAVFPGRWTAAAFAPMQEACLIVFGDNEVRRGCAGQACVRPLRHAMGIPTKRLPSMRQEAFWSDAPAAFRRQHEALRAAVAAIYRRIMQHASIRFLVLPEECWGSGLAQLPRRAPRTYALLRAIYSELLAGTSLAAARENGRILRDRLCP